MRLAHKLVIIGGLVGVLGFFLPLFDVGYMGAEVKISSLKLVREGEATLDISTEKERENFDIFKIVIFVGFGGALLLLLMALFGARRFGRGLGLLSLLFGLCALGTWLLLHLAFNEAIKEDGQDFRGLGVWALLAAGGGGVLGGLFALIAPERRD